MAQLTRRRFVQLAAFAAVGGYAALETACSRGPKQKTIRFFNWFNYIGKETLPRFERETGVKVTYEVYSTEDEMFAKLKAGVRGYDLLVATDFMIPRLKMLDLIEPIPQNLLQNLDNIDARFRDPIYDPGLQYSIPYLWGTTGIGYNTAKISKPPDTWWALWDEKYKGRITMLDAMRDAMAVSLLMLGLPYDSKNPAHLAKAKDLLLKQKPLLKQYTTSGYVDDLASGEIWIAQGWNGDVLQAAREKKQIDYVIPKEGSFIYVDSVVLLKGAARKQHVLELVDHLLKPDVAAEISNTVRYASPNAKALPLLDKELTADRRVFPTPEMQKKLHLQTPLDPEADELWNQTWQDVKVL
ncbi:MAG: spermidine/putrescine ABC transporter substrate-binding protein [Elusimicrobia bacterium]|nr:spermidine/putrescine ABC transporter substrate-binding protein [Elusimicrobiota bacterium]